MELLFLELSIFRIVVSSLAVRHDPLERHGIERRNDFNHQRFQTNNRRQTKFG